MKRQLGINLENEMNAKETVAWECANCGTRHIWRWPKGEALACEIRMDCEACGSTTLTRLVQIGIRAWVALWPGR